VALRVNSNIQLDSIGKRVIRYVLVENLIYWLTGSIVWIPWVYAKWLGILAMITLVPFTIVIATLYCLHKVPIKIWKKEIWLMIVTFILTCAVIDLFFWIIWRGHKILEWYLPTTQTGIGNAIGYLEMVISAIVILILMLKVPRLQKANLGAKITDLHIAILAAIFFLINIYCAVVYWN